MDKFVKNMKEIKDEIYKLEEKYIYDNKKRHKHILLYYLYRIICKHNDVLKVNTDPATFDKIFDSLDIPKDMKDKCYPIIGEIPNDDKILDESIEAGIEVLEKAVSNIKEDKTGGNKEKIDNFRDFFITKNSKKIIKEDFVLLTALLPKFNKDKLKPTLNI